jgi:hypothetical protein
MAISKENENLQDLVTLAHIFSQKNHMYDSHCIFFCVIEWQKFAQQTTAQLSLSLCAYQINRN